MAAKSSIELAMGLIIDPGGVVASSDLQLLFAISGGTGERSLGSGCPRFLMVGSRWSSDELDGSGRMDGLERAEIWCVGPAGDCEELGGLDGA